MPRNTSDCSSSSLLVDVRLHQMSVLRNDGVNRHLRFRRADSNTFWFDIITWPGTLCIDGDMGTFVFRRVEDMLQFFRADINYGKSKSDELYINPGYWAEKIKAAPRHKGVTEFDESEFDTRIREYFKGWIRDHYHDTTRSERRDLWQSIEILVLGEQGDGGGYRKQIAAHDFHEKVNEKVSFEFRDFWEVSCEAYTYHYIWCCYAVVWGIQQFDLALEKKESVENEA